MFSLCEANINYHKFHINIALISVFLRPENIDIKIDILINANSMNLNAALGYINYP